MDNIISYLPFLLIGVSAVVVAGVLIAGATKSNTSAGSRLGLLDVDDSGYGLVGRRYGKSSSMQSPRDYSGCGCGL